MQRNNHTNVEREHIIVLAFWRLFWEKSSKICSKICIMWVLWLDRRHAMAPRLSKRGYHYHIGANGRFRISIAVRNQILSLFMKDPTISLCATPTRDRVRASTIGGALCKKFDLYHYRLQMSITPVEDHKESIFDFAKNCLMKHKNGVEYLEGLVSASDIIFRKVAEYWYWTPESCMVDASRVSVSHNIVRYVKIGVIGPTFLETKNSLTVFCKRMLPYFLVRKLQDYSEELIFYQDSAGLHYYTESREFLGQKLLNQPIGRCRPISWPSCSPYVTHATIFCVGTWRAKCTEIFFRASIIWKVK